MQCRICGQEIPGNPLLSYQNMPKSAQFFPALDEADTECGVDLHLYQCALLSRGDPRAARVAGDARIPRGAVPRLYRAL